MNEWFLSVLQREHLVTFLSGLIVAYFGFYIRKYFSRGKIYLIDNKVHFSVSSHNEIAENKSPCESERRMDLESFMGFTFC